MYRQREWKSSPRVCDNNSKYVFLCTCVCLDSFFLIQTKFTLFKYRNRCQRYHHHCYNCRHFYVYVRFLGCANQFICNIFAKVLVAQPLHSHSNASVYLHFIVQSIASWQTISICLSRPPTKCYLSFFRFVRTLSFSHPLCHLWSALLFVLLLLLLLL